MGGVLVNSLVIGFLYFKNINWKSFLLFNVTQGTLFQFWTPSFLRGYGCGTPNGSLWTIGVMVQSYVILWFLFIWLHKKALSKWCIAFGLTTVMGGAASYLGNVIPVMLFKLIRQTFIPYIGIFIFGAMLAEHFEYIQSTVKKWWPVALLLSIAIRLLNLNWSEYDFLPTLFLCLAIVGFAYQVDIVKIKHDLSYGIYIYHMIVLNAFLQIGVEGTLLNSMAVVILSVLLAAVSYVTIGSISRAKRCKIAN